MLQQAQRALVARLVGDDDPALAVEEVDAAAELGAVLDACATPAFLTERRVVVVPEAGRFRADEVDPLVAYLREPMLTTSLVLVAGGGQMPTRLTKAIKEVGHVEDASAPSGKGRQAWLQERLRAVPITLERPAVALLSDRIGEELGQVDGVLTALVTAYGEGARLGADEVEPFLGSNGSAAPWELTDAIDAGDVETALAQLRRMLDGGGRHPLVVMATLQKHFGAMLRLDGADVEGEAGAAALVGMSPYPAKKVLAQSRRLGSAAIARAIRLLSQADLDLRGGSAWPGELVLEVLVARLTRLQSSSVRGARS